MKHRILLSLSAAGLAAAAATSAGAGQEGSALPAPEPGSQPPALAGPKVSEVAARPTLVRRDYEGRLRALDSSAEEAALALLTLDDPTRARVDAVLESYAARLDAIVADNLGLLTKLVTSKGGRRDEYNATLRELTAVLRPLRENGGLKAEVARELPPDQRERFESLLSEYWAAAIDDELQSSAPGGTPGAGGAEGPRRRAAAVKVTLAAAGREVKRSFDRLVASREDAFKDFSARLDLAPDQDARVKQIFTDLYVETLGKPTPDQRRAAILKAMQELSPEQRAAFAADMLEQRRPKK